MTDGFVSVGKISDFQPNQAPTDITPIVQKVAPTAVPRMLTRFSDAVDGSPLFASVASTCTHRGCPILTGDGVWGSTDKPIYESATHIITCPCHNSQFDAGVGQVVRGPARIPLLPFATEIRNGEVYVAISASAASPLSLIHRAGYNLRAAFGGTVFPGTGNKYLVDFGAFVVELFFENDGTLTYTGVRRDGSRGQSETVTIETTYLRDFLFMVTWQESDKTSVVHIEDYDQYVIHTNITNPDQSFVKYRGTFNLIR
ncbi:MAG: Rieske (2Fe-2S) protein [Rhodopseudomonas sp.]|uniref:QcrA and Rieske domain-containing protein n=1 Tax=Rhodopseudomonas sp. TaxID=1078 RepID=UPI00179785DF|nr:Rieske (2Fe-2S) protein [Rhodopseudomonas sp.]NVN84571.1 Rieske (2Fe-2S) protein [Rhodopseudomonas sp.]